MRTTKHLLIALLCLTFALTGCSMEPGGSEDPADFKTSLTPPAGNTPAATEEAAASPDQLTNLETALSEATGRLDALEQDVQMLKETVASIEATAHEALGKVSANPLADIDLSDEAAAGKELMEQSLEQIIGISRLLLDKMEGKLEEADQAAPQETTVQEPAVEAQ